MKKIEKNNIVINYSEILEPLSLKTIDILKIKVEEYKSLFDINNLETIVVNYFADLEEFREFIYKLRGQKDLPEYARGTYDKGMINACIEPDKQMNRVTRTSHELFHILYLKYILKNNYANRIGWYDEGMAQFFSGEKKNLEIEENFKRFYYEVKNSTKLVPKINELKHGNSFRNDNYNAYSLSYLAIKYLYETISFADFKALMSDFDRIKEIGEIVLYEMFEYYDIKYENKKVVK